MKDTKIEWADKLVTFRNGYYATSRSFIAEIRLSIGYGEPKWGAKEGERYLVLTIVKIMNEGAAMVRNKNLVSDSDTKNQGSIARGVRRSWL